MQACTVSSRQNTSPTARRGKINEYVHMNTINTPARRLDYYGVYDILLSDRYMKCLPAAPSGSLKEESILSFLNESKVYFHS